MRQKADYNWSMFFESLHNEIVETQRKMNARFHELKEIIKMSSPSNPSGANLQAADANLKALLNQLFNSVTEEIADFKAQLAAALKASGVPQSTVDSVTADLNTMASNVTAALGSVTTADPGLPLAISAVTFPSLQEGVAIAQPAIVVTTTGGISPVTISVAGLPSDLTVDATGNLTGTPKVGDAGTDSVVVTATDSKGNTASMSVSVTILAAAVPPAPTSGTSGASSGSAGTPAAEAQTKS